MDGLAQCTKWEICISKSIRLAYSWQTNSPIESYVLPFHLFLALFYFVFEDNFQGLHSEGQFNWGLSPCNEFGGLTFGRECTWKKDEYYFYWLTREFIHLKYSTWQTYLTSKTVSQMIILCETEKFKIYVSKLNSMDSWSIFYIIP